MRTHIPTGFLEFGQFTKLLVFLLSVLVFLLLPFVSNAAALTLSGTLYSDEGVSAVTATKTIFISVGTSTPSLHSTTTVSGTGTWTFVIPDGQTIVPSTPILVWVDGDSLTRAALFTKASSSVNNIPNLDLYQNKVIISHEGTSGTTTTNSNLSFYDGDNDADIQYTSNGGTLTVNTNNELYVKPNKTFNPGGNVTASSSVRVTTGATFTAPTNLIVGGSFRNYGTFTHNDGTVTMDPVATDVMRYVAGRDASGSTTGTGAITIRDIIIANNHAYVAKNSSATACSQTAGSAIGCELQVYDISSSTNPVYVAGRDASGDSTGVGSVSINSLVLNGNYLYIGKNSNSTACSQTAGAAIGCEFMVFDVSSSTNPIYIVGRDADGGASGVGLVPVYSLTIFNNFLFVGKGWDSTACSQTPDSALGCELQVYNISSSTNPVYVAGRDASGSATGTETNVYIWSLAVSGNYLYVGKSGNATTCSQTAGSAIGCELMVFDISSSTNPVYVAGRDVSGSSNGVAQYAYINSLFVSGNYLHVGVGNGGDATACSQTAGSAQGCELQVYDISSSTNPVYVAGRDASGSENGTAVLVGVNDVFIAGNYLYVSKGGDSTACSQTAGSAIGCELMVFDISSSTNPVYVAGRDTSGSSNGSGNLVISSFFVSKNYLYVGKNGNSTACSQIAGSAIGCELMVFDISNANAVSGYLMGNLSNTNAFKNLGINGTTTLATYASTTNFTINAQSSSTIAYPLSISGNYTNNGGLYALATTSFIGSTAQSLSGSMTGSSKFTDVTFSGSGTKTFANDATMNNFTIVAGAAVVQPGILTIEGNYQNDGTLNATATSTMYFTSASAQTLSGTMNSSTTDFGNVIFTGVGTKTFTSNASTTNLTIESGATLVAPSDNLTVSRSFRNYGTFNHSNATITIESLTSPLMNYVAGRDISADSASTSNTEIRSFATKDNYLYVGHWGSGTACTQTAGFAIGCELQVYDISSPSNPVYVAGRDSSGSSNGTAFLPFFSLQIQGNYLYVGKYFSGTACSQVAGSASGCEIMVFDISSSTNPVYVAGRDASGSSAGTATSSVYSVITSGTYLYAGKHASSTACSQTAGSAGGCEILVFDISAPTNPVFVAGRDASGNASGVGNISVNAFVVNGNSLYVAKAANATACSQVAGSAVGCELMVFNISSSTNPIFVAGRDINGSPTGAAGASVLTLVSRGNYLYVGNQGFATTCSQTAGSASGCELQVYDISSSTNPIYVAGRDSAAGTAATGATGVYSFSIHGNTLYAGKNSSSTVCTQAAGSAEGCELIVFDISVPTNPIYVAGRDISGSATGTAAGTLFYALQVVGNYIYTGKQGNATACSQVSGSAVGCELMVFNAPTDASYLQGTLNATSSFNTLSVRGAGTIFLDNATTSNLTIASGATLIAPPLLTITGNYTNNGTTTFGSGTTTFSGASAQTATGTMTGTSAFNNVVITNASASTTFAAPVTVNGNFSAFTPGTILVFTANATSTFATTSIVGSLGSPIKLRSTQNGVQFGFDVNGAYTFTNLDIKDSHACGGGSLTVSNYINSGNNTCWSVATFLSGLLYSDEGITPITTTKTLGIAIGTSTPSVSSVTTNASGAWTFSVPSGHTITPSTPILVWVDNDSTTRGALLTKATSSSFNIDNLNLYQNRLIISHEATGGTSTTLADMGRYDGDNDADIQFSVNVATSTLTVFTGNELYIQTGKTFAPGGAVTIHGNASSTSLTDGSFRMTASSMYTAAGTTTIAGSFSASSTATFTPHASGTIFTATTTGKTITAPIATLGTTTLNGVGGVWTFATSATTSNLTIATGATLIAPPLLTITGNYTNNGTTTFGTGTTTFSGASAQTATGTMTGTSAFNNVVITNASASTTFAAPVTVNGNFSALTPGTILVFTANATSTFATTTIVGSGGGPIKLRSTTNGTQFGFRVTGAYTFNNLDIKDSNACYGGYLVASNYTNSGNNSCWDIATFLSGLLYSDEGITPITTTKTLGIAIGTSTPSVSSATTNASGAWTFSVPGGHTITPSTPILVWVDNDQYTRAALFTKASSSVNNITALDLYQNKVIISHEGTSGTSTTNSNLSFYDRDNDADIQYTSNGGTLTVNTNSELYIKANKTFNPGGNVIASSSVRINTDATFTAPADLTIGGSFRNYGTFTHNSGTVTMDPIVTDVARYVAGRDAQGDETGVGSAFINDTVRVGNMLYVGKSGSTTACSQVVGSAVGCELQVYDISSSTNPIYVAGRDSSGNSSGIGATDIRDLIVKDSYLYMGKSNISTACSQTPGSADGCELMVFDISSTTNPIYVAGRDSSGSSNGIATIDVHSLVVKDNYLYAAKTWGATACSQVAGSASGCELMVFDISSTTNPIYVAGRDVSGSATGTASESFYAIDISGNYLYLGTWGDPSACSQTTGSANGCELQVYDISSSTNPMYVAGRDVSGSAGGTGSLAITGIRRLGNTLYITKNANGTACSQTVGSAIGCELMVFDISSSTNPIYVAGRDASGTLNGGDGSISLYAVFPANDRLYIGKTGNATQCFQPPSSAAGCELQVYDISSTTNPVYVAARDASGSVDGTGSVTIYSLLLLGNNLYVGQGGSVTACSQTPGSGSGCELTVFEVTNDLNPGQLLGVATGTSALNHLTLRGTTILATAASTTNFTVSVGGTTTTAFPLSTSGNFQNNGIFTTSERLTVSGDYTNSGIFTATQPLTIAGHYQNNGTSTLPEETFFTGPSSQTLGGTMAGVSKFNDVIFSGSGPKTFTSNASTTNFTIQSGASVVSPEILTISGNYDNEGAFNHGSGLINFAAQPGYFEGGVDISGSVSGVITKKINTFAVSGNYLYVGTHFDITPCSQTAGSAVGCELQVYDISSPENSFYVAGRDVSGSIDGVGNNAIYSLTISGNYLYVGKGEDSTTCSQVAGSAIGCELQIYDISSSTNPVYIAGRDLDGSATGATAHGPIYTSIVLGNYLYLGTEGDPAPCSQAAGSAQGCELQVYDISSSTNPIYVAGRDAAGDISGLSNKDIYTFALLGNYLYVGTFYDSTACSQIAGSAIGCELMVFDISSSTNPIYVAGRDSSASSDGTLDDYYQVFSISGNYLYVGKEAYDPSACSQTAGSAGGCELHVYDISSSTNPVYVAGRDSSGSSDGVLKEYTYALTISGNYMYVGKGEDSTTCSQVAGSAIGCELQIYDISSSTNPVYIAGRDANGSDSGTTGSRAINTLAVVGNNIYAGKDGDSTACSQVAGSAIGCELMVFSIGGTVDGILSGTSAFNDVSVQGLAEFLANASTSDLTISSGATLVTPEGTLSVSGNYTNLGTFTAGSGTTTFNGTSQQTATGTMTGTSAFSNLVVANTSQNGSTSQSLILGAPASTTQTFKMLASTSVLMSSATSTFTNISLGGVVNQYVWLRSQASGTPWGLVVPGTQEQITYVNVKDSHACSGNPAISAVDGTSVDAGGNTCWDFPPPYATISSAAHQTFSYAQPATAIEAITVRDSLSIPTITAENDIRIKIATSSVNMLWDTTDTTATIGGTAAGKVSTTVTYENNGATLVIPVNTNFVGNESITISDLSFTSFGALNIATTALALYTGGVDDTIPADFDDKTVTVTGSLTVGLSSAGQINNAFNSTNEFATPLYTFRFTAQGEDSNVSSLIFSLTGIVGIAEGELSNTTLYHDVNSNGAYDGGDIQVGGTGAVSIAGQSGTVTFSTTIPVASTTPADYVLVGDVTSVRVTDSINIVLESNTITTTGVTMGLGINEIVTVGRKQHMKGGGGAGSNGGAIGGNAPTGQGQTGGGSQGGGSIDPNSGTSIGNEPDFFAPSSTGAPFTAWANGSNAYSSDGVYTTTSSNSAQQSYGNFGFNVPGTNAITGIAVKIEANGTGTISVRLSWDGGSSVTSLKTTAALSNTDGVYTLGHPSDLWGRTWTAQEFTNANFKIEVLANTSGDTLQIDAIQVNVYHQATGGGQGGGGAVWKESDQHYASVISAFKSDYAMAAVQKAVTNVGNFWVGMVEKVIQLFGR